MGKTKILIVDDDPDFTRSVQVILESRNYTVRTAASGTEGMTKIEADRPDLVILDVMMASLGDGIELARQLRENPGLVPMPILMVTAVKEKTGIDFRSSAGDETWLPVDAFLDKPVASHVLLAEVERLLSR